MFIVGLLLALGFTGCSRGGNNAAGGAGASDGKDAAATDTAAVAAAIDTDADGYPDFWEDAHENEGYNAAIPDTPYGIDLSLLGAVPPGVTLDQDNNIYTVQLALDGTNHTYQVYNSVPGQNMASLSIAEEVETSLLLNEAVVSGETIVNDGAVLTLQSVGASADKLTLRVPAGADVTIVLNGVRISGGAPLTVAEGAAATLLLAGENTLSAGQGGAAGINVPAGADLVIDSYASRGAGSESGSLIVTGGTGTDDSPGAGAGIGGNFTEEAGSITLLGGTIYAAGGDGGSAWGGAAGIGNGGFPNNGAGNKRGGTTLVKGGRVI